MTDARPDKVDVKREAAALEEFWSQRIVGEANGSLFKVAKGIGTINWHSHADMDEVFFVYKGSLTIHLRDGDVELAEGDMCVVPRGVEHSPEADEEVHLLVVGTEITSNAAGGKPAWSYTQPPTADDTG